MRKAEEDRKRKFKASRDEEEKEWSFPHLDKVLAELKPDQSNIGALMAAMIYQIEQQNKKDVDVSVARQFILKHEEQESKLNDYLDDVFSKIAIEHNVVEATFKHQFTEQVVQRNAYTSPYQSLFNEKDIASQISSGYTFLNGDSISKSEIGTLTACNLPGINNRNGMPTAATVQ